MALPVNIRVNLYAPFPSNVTGSGPVTIAKQNGNWVFGLSFTQLQIQNPPIPNFNSDYVLVWDNVAKQFLQVSLLTLTQVATASRNQRSATVSPITVASTDMIINVNISSGTPTCTLPLASTRSGIPVTFKDVGAQFAAHNLTITAAGADTIDGAASITLTANRQAVTLVPFNDGINTGWFIN